MIVDNKLDFLVIQAKVIGVKTRSHKAKYYNAENEDDSLTKNVKMYNRYKIEIITAYKVNYNKISLRL